MTITHHLDDATLMSFAAGSLPNTLAAVAAAHISMCVRCRSELAVHERIGGALVETIPGSEMRHRALELPERNTVRAEPARASQVELPHPLAGIIGHGLDEVRWRWIGPGLWHRPLPIGGAGSLHLIKGAPSASVPEHDHGGSELTLVLRGALIDATGRYGPGDIADIDEGIEHHAPVADQQEGCICVIANENPTRFRGLLARLMQPWHGM